MHFSHGAYQPQPHIVEEILTFPDEGLTIKQIQQFLKILNDIRDFIPNEAKHTSQLSKLLKKNPLAWGPQQQQLSRNL